MYIWVTRYSASLSVKCIFFSSVVRFCFWELSMAGLVSSFFFPHSSLKSRSAGCPDMCVWGGHGQRGSELNNGWFLIEIKLGREQSEQACHYQGNRAEYLILNLQSQTQPDQHARFLLNNHFIIIQPK